MKLITLILMLFIISSCDQAVSFKGMEAKIFNRWISVSSTKVLGPEYFNSGMEIESPPMVWRPLMEVMFTANDGKDGGRQCLFYRTPHKKSKGVIKVISIKEGESCSYLIDAETEPSFVTVRDVEKLKIYFSTAPIRVDGSAKFMDTFTLIMKFRWGDESREWRFPFYNMSVRDQKEFRKLYSSPAKRSIIPGVHVWPKIEIESSMNNKADSFLGKLTDSYPDKGLIACHKVDDKCNSITPNRCSRCRYGFFEVAGSNCKGGGTKFCGPNRCGEKGWPACKRGLSYKKYPVEPGCYPDSPAGFCREGLRVICDSNKVLICN